MIFFACPHVNPLRNVYDDQIFHARESTAIQSTGKPLYIIVTPNLPIVRRACFALTI